MTVVNKYPNYWLIKELDLERDSSPPEKNGSAKWTEIEELVLEETIPLLKHLKTNQWKIPETGYELTNKIGTVIAEAELAWIDDQFAVVSDESDVQPFIENNWNATTIDQILRKPESYRQQYLT